MKRTTFLAAVFALTAGVALAQSATDAAVAGFQAAGYSRIEVKTGPNQVKIEAIKGAQKVEVIIDRNTGAVLKRETETVGVGENTSPGVFFDSRNDDFTDGSDDSSDDDSDDDDDDDDDNSGHGGGDDDDDDHGGSGGSGSDDD